MKIAPSIVLTMVLFLLAGPVMAQDAATTPPDTSALAAVEEELMEYSDYMAKAYSLTAFYGVFSGATYLDNSELDERTVLTQGAADILGYDGEVLAVSQDVLHYEAAQKKIESGPIFGARFGIFANKDFHLDLIGSYATGKAVTSMLYKPDEADPSLNERLVVDEDDGYSLIKGGVHLGYDAYPASFWGITPKLGFGLGGLINSYSVLEDKTALYLEGNFGLKRKLSKNLDIVAQVDMTTFAYDVDELGYSNIVNYTTFSVGLHWFIDVVPDEVKARHLAELEASDR